MACLKSNLVTLTRSEHRSPGQSVGIVHRNYPLFFEVSFFLLEVHIANLNTWKWSITRANI